ncbi:phosphotransferase family protein [Sphingopyxis macrogoltabida]|uniref:Aminoglycoside phosphotransferase domain-containing protein n=1 Tax=Sphingopyxis macrogoltabida TaxID=33050 RepID=A0AAC9FHG0_SPHMC|nr:phosphotransferase family protein [Sphingopyxis macrogoltabida]ALJ16336.1 hypothetical protein LH19_26400 [Sphingopyxis macrogoltabida]AMU92573.1 hypothetical protein ATM17_30400 [Sphingopyxis macrogoltabida]
MATSQLDAISDGLDKSRLGAFLARSLPGDWGRLSATPFVGGQSNPTYLLAAGPERYVLRKQPAGTLLPSAHAVDREYRIMAALAPTGVAVPRVRLFSDDRGIVGTPFYVMDFVNGRLFRDPLLGELESDERAAVHDAMNDMLARLHHVDPAAHGLGDYGKAGDYFARQIARWSRQYRESETQPIAAMDELIRRLPGLIPDDGRVAIAHGDYRLENLLFHPDRPEVLAVLDWELSTLGHPLADLAYNCFCYHLPERAFHGLADRDLAGSGVPCEEEYVARYVARTGRPLDAPWGHYMAFALFRLAAILQGVLRRALDGQAASPDSLQRGALAGLCAEAGLAALDRK